MRKRTSRKYKQRPRRKKRRLPRLKTIFYAAICTVIIAVAAAFVVDCRSYLHTSERFAVTEVDVVGAKLLSPAEICRVSGLYPGISLFVIDADEVADRVESMPRVRHAEVDRQPPHHVAITVDEREPVAVIDAGQQLEVDSEGVVLGPPVESDSIAPLPVITGITRVHRFIPGVTVKDKSMREAIRLCELLVRTGSVPLLGVETIDVSDPDNLVMYIQDVSAQIRWGTGDYELKLAKLIAVWDKAGGRLPHSEYVDLRQGKYIPAK